MDDRLKVIEALSSLRSREAYQHIEVSCVENLAKVSVVGLGMISHPGVASKVFTTLAAGDIDIMMISTSEIKISCVVGGDRADAAAAGLHEVFIS